MSTETRNPRSTELDRLSTLEVVELMASEEVIVLDALSKVSDQLALAAEHVAEAYSLGGRTFLLGSGTSGRLAVQEVAELPPTFGVAPTSFIAYIASGPTGGPAAITSTEDDARSCRETLERDQLGPNDIVIGVAASGTTPFVLEGIRVGLERGAWTCGIANNADTPLLALPDLGILLDTGPELVTGSTRLKAGTSQKVALNRITTAAMVRAGKVLSNLMVEISPTNAKLRRRAVSIVSELTGCGASVSEYLLESNDWRIRDAAAAGRGTEH